MGVEDEDAMQQITGAWTGFLDDDFMAGGSVCKRPAAMIGDESPEDEQVEGDALLASQPEDDDLPASQPDKGQDTYFSHKQNKT